MVSLSVFNSASHFAAYEKRSKKLPINEEAYEKQMIGDISTEDNQARIDLLVKDLEKQKEARTKFRRHRLPDPDQKELHVSERNRQFNERLQKQLGPHVKDLANRDTRPAT